MKKLSILLIGVFFSVILIGILIRLIDNPLIEQNRDVLPTPSTQLRPDVTNIQPDIQPERVKDTGWVTYDNKIWGLTFRYPESWPVRDDGQSFENGDLLALQVVGQTQELQMELYDGVAFAVMNPVVTNQDLSEWTRETYGTTSELDPQSSPEYTEARFGGVRYEKVYVCGWGCFTYFHKKQNGKIYGFMLLAVGPDAPLYESTASEIMESIRYY